MQDLIKLETQIWGNEKVQTVNARDLWEKLEVQTRFNDWIVRRISDSYLVDGQDFTSLLKIEEREIGATTRREYYLSLDAAKHIAMLEGNEKGKQIRQYFIEVEKKSRMILEGSTNSKLMIPIREAQVTFSCWMEVARLINVPKHIAQVEANKATKNVTGIDFSPLLLVSPSQDNIKDEEKMLEPSELGRLLGIEGGEIVRGKKVNNFLFDLGLQRKENKNWEVTEEGKKYSSSHQWSRGEKSGYNLKWSLHHV